MDDEDDDDDDSGATTSDGEEDADEDEGDDVAAHTLLVKVGIAPFFARGCAPAVLTGVCESVLASVERIPLLLLLLRVPGDGVDAGEGLAAVVAGAAVLGDAWRRACGVMLPGTAVFLDVRQNDIKKEGEEKREGKRERKEGSPSLTHT